MSFLVEMTSLENCIGRTVKLFFVNYERAEISISVEGKAQLWLKLHNIDLNGRLL